MNFIFRVYQHSNIDLGRLAPFHLRKKSGSVCVKESDHYCIIARYTDFPQSEVSGADLTSPEIKSFCGKNHMFAVRGAEILP